MHNRLEQLSDSGFDLRSSQVVHLKKIIGLTRSRKLVDASMVNLETVFSESTRDGLEDTTSFTVFFNDVELAVGSGDAFSEGLFIDGLDGEEIDQSDVDSFSLELFNSFLGFNQGDTSGGNGQFIFFVSEDDLSLTDFELFVVLVDEGRVRSGGSDVDGAVVVGSEADSSFTRDGIRRIEDNGSNKGSELSEVFKTHLGGTIFTEGDTSVGTDVLDVGEGDATHSHLIESSGEESSESGTESNLLSATQTLSNTDHVLFSDETFNELLRVSSFQDGRVGGGLGVTINSEQSVGLVTSSESLQGVTVSSSDGNFLGGVVVEGIGHGEGGFFRGLGFEGGLGRGDLDVDVLDQGFKVINDLRGFLSQSLTVPVQLIFNVSSEVSSLEGLGNNGEGLSIVVLSGFLEGLDAVIDVVTVNDDGFPTESSESFSIWFETFISQGGVSGLSETVDIDNGGEVIELVVSSEVSSFPDGTFNGFTVSHHTVVSVGDFINVLGGISHTAGD